MHHSSSPAFMFSNDKRIRFGNSAKRVETVHRLILFLFRVKRHHVCCCCTEIFTTPYFFVTNTEVGTVCGRVCPLHVNVSSFLFFFLILCRGKNMFCIFVYILKSIKVF